MVLHLTDELVARTSRAIDDAGPAPGLVMLEDEDFAAIRDRLLAERPEGALWIFAYGSLLWNCCFEPADERAARAHGWHRRFAFWLTRWRGTRDLPGLMMALDRGGSCSGIIYRIADTELSQTLDVLLRREMSAKPPTNVPRWVTVRSGQESLRAIAFVADRKGPAYAGGVSEEETVAVLARAAGHIGSCAQYLHSTVVHLEHLNMRDSTLWRLQKKVAAFLSGEAGANRTNSIREISHACEG